jgi:hypothetical protein
MSTEKFTARNIHGRDAAENLRLITCDKIAVAYAQMRLFTVRYESKSVENMIGLHAQLLALSRTIAETLDSIDTYLTA